MLAAIDIHKAIFQAAVLNPDTGEITDERFQASRKVLIVWIASRKVLIVWIAKWHDQVSVVALEATTGWRWVARELQARGITSCAAPRAPISVWAEPSHGTLTTTTARHTTRLRQAPASYRSNRWISRG